MVTINRPLQLQYGVVYVSSSRIRNQGKTRGEERPEPGQRSENSNASTPVGCSGDVASQFSNGPHGA